MSIACPICGGATLRSGRSVTGEPMRMCVDCRHVFFEDIPTTEAIGRYYAERYAESHDQLALQESCRGYLGQHAGELLHEVATRGLPARSIDYGSSYPVFSDEARRAGFERALSVEPSADASSWAASRGLEVVPPWEFPDEGLAGQFGVMRFSHSLEHLPDPLGALRAAARALAPGGLVYVTQPSFPVCRAADVEAVYADSVYPEHIHQFCALSLRRLLEGAGFEIVRLFCFQKEDAQAEAFAAYRDDAYAAERLGDLAPTVPPYVSGPGANPTYFGENSVALARLRA